MESLEIRKITALHPTLTLVLEVPLLTSATTAEFWMLSTPVATVQLAVVLITDQTRWVTFLFVNCVLYENKTILLFTGQKDRFAYSANVYVNLLYAFFVSIRYMLFVVSYFKTSLCFFLNLSLYGYCYVNYYFVNQYRWASKMFFCNNYKKHKLKFYF